MNKHKKNKNISKEKKETDKNSSDHETSLGMPMSHYVPNKEKKPYERLPEGLIEKYSLESEGAKVRVSIEKKLNQLRYNLNIPEVDIATRVLMRDIRNNLVSFTSISMKELMDQESFGDIKEKFKKDANELFLKKIPNIPEESRKFLVGLLLQEMVGLGKIEFLISDENLEEIVVPNSKEPIRVFSRKYGWLETNITIEKEEEILNYANVIARRVGKQVSVLNPLLDAHLVSGDRINAVLYPINTKGNTITIRKFARDPYTMIDFIKNKTCDLETAALLWLAIEYEMNIIVSGGTGSGKTSFLNACMPFIPPNQRILSIEDTRELMLPEFLYWTPLVTRTPNTESKGEVSMLDLLVNSLRMRPDRIILGEMRRKEEAMVLFEAMHTGHSVYATVHADTAPETISRLTNPPLSVPQNLLRAVNLNVVMFRDRRKGIRRVLQIAEFDSGKEEAKANILYRWTPENDSLVKHNPSLRFFEDLSRHTGMSDMEIEKNIIEKRKILSHLAEKGIRSLSQLGKIIDMYYKNKEILIEKINKNKIEELIN